MGAFQGEKLRLWGEKCLLTIGYRSRLTHHPLLRTKMWSWRQTYLHSNTILKRLSSDSPMKSKMRFIKSSLEYRGISEISLVPPGTRGIYVLYQRGASSYDVVYVGMSGKEVNGRIKNRLISHKRNIRKDWSHFSYYEVWDNIDDTEIREIEGLFRQIYRFDERANFYNTQLTHKPLLQVRRETERELGISRITKRTLGL